MDSNYLDIYLKRLYPYVMPIISKMHENNGIDTGQKVTSQKEDKIIALFLNCTEIQNTIETILDYEVYIRQFPYKNTRIIKSRHLKNTIANYLNEIYILKLRLVDYLKKTERTFTDVNIKAIIRNKFQSEKEAIIIAFESIIQMRGGHIHEKRYDTKDLNFISSVEFLASSDNSFSLLYKNTYNEEHKKWIKTIKKNNQDILVIINRYFLLLTTTLFDTGLADYLK